MLILIHLNGYTKTYFSWNLYFDALITLHKGTEYAFGTLGANSYMNIQGDIFDKNVVRVTKYRAQSRIPFLLWRRVLKVRSYWKPLSLPIDPFGLLCFWVSRTDCCSLLTVAYVLNPGTANLLWCKIEFLIATFSDNSPPSVETYLWWVRW